MSKTPAAVIREATVADVPLIRELAHASWWAHYPGIISKPQIDYMLDWMYSESQLREDLDTGVEFLILECEQPLGFAGWECDFSRATAKLHKLYLVPEAVGSGYGRLLLSEVLNRAKHAGMSGLELGVNKHNHRAIKAYERFGFQRQSSVCNDIGHGFVMDDYIYSLPL
jgi:GNAT superfamily N-acetyltransferase